MARRELWRFRNQAVARIDLTGFELHGLDGPLGRVVQSIEGSAGGYLVVDPGAAMPLGRQVLVPAGLVDEVEVDKRRVGVRAERDQIRNAPEYDPGQTFDERWLTGMDEHYGPLMGEGPRRARPRASTKRKASSGSGARKGQAGGSRRTSVRSTSRSRSRRTAEGPTKEELYSEAKRFGIEGRSKMSKAQLARAVGSRRGGSGSRGRTRAKANPVEVQAFLEGVGYPTRKRELLREAESQGARREVRATLRRLPDKRFQSPTDVSEAIGRLG
jgi:hypothetical protein